MDLEAYDFDRATTTRTRLRAAAAAEAPEDIAAALTRSDTPDDLLSTSFHVVSDLAILRGLAQGPVAVPSEVADTGPTGAIDAADDQACALLYQRVLLRGTAELQEQILNATRLHELWPHLSKDLPDTVREVWQHRFPRLGNR
ncbi:hypothetical protein ACNPQN_32750 [Streptomyces sp. NPDC056297]|uniref:hypothetical protein n=1 Tax=unclassified Streptomyces TaxID=2593676 RepID=UPI0035DF1DEC